MRQSPTINIQKRRVHTSSIASSRKGRIQRLVLDAVRGFLGVGSGDQVAAILAKQLKATDLVFATDVSGVFDADPKTSASARLVPELSLSRKTIML